MKGELIECLFCVLFSTVGVSAFTSSALSGSLSGSPNVRPSAVPSLTDAAKTPIEVTPISSTFQRRKFLAQIATVASIPLPSHATDTNEEKPFHSAAFGQEEYTNSIVASRDTNISPREVYDTIASEYLTNVLDIVNQDGGVARALDVGAGAGVSTEVLFRLGYHHIDAFDWSGTAWQKYVVDDPSGYCPSNVNFYELDDERYLDLWKSKYSNRDGLFDVIVFNFAVNEAKAKLFATQLLNKQHGIVLAPINTMNDYWLKQNYKVINSEGDVLWSTADVGAWSVQFQPDVTQDTCSGVWCAPFNGFQKKK